MKKLLVAVAAIGLTVFSTSCKKCYDCRDHCVQCNINGTNITGCASNGNYQSVKTSCTLTGGTLTELGGVTDQEVCGKPDYAEESSSALEVLGYTCSDK